MTGTWLKRSISMGLLVATSLVVVACGDSTTSASSSSVPSAKFNSQAWSAVFLNNREVFFGHIASVSADTIDLNHVYYLQQVNGTTSTSTKNPTSQTLVFGLVGSQIQCPTDEIQIDRHNVLYFEELQSSSVVVGKITGLEKNAKTCFVPPTAAPTPTK